MIELGVTWEGDTYLEGLEERAWEALARATVYLHTRCMEALNVSNPREYVLSKTQKTKSGKAKRVGVYRSPSKPGEPPRKRTGWLQKNVRYELDRERLKGRVGIGTNAKYGAFLEIGTKRLKARPWLWATAQAHLHQLRSIVRGGT
jgi:hypothetical protein